MTSGTDRDRDWGRLMEAAQTGDADAYLALLTGVTPWIRQVVARQRGFAGPEAVEDLVQDVLLSLHSARATYDPRRPFMPWLLAIVRNRLVDGARRYARTVAREVPAEDLDVTFLESGANLIQEQYREQVQFQDAELLRHAVRALPAGQRQAIELLKGQEMSLKEAAAVSGVSVGALKVATHRAMTALRKALGADSERL